MSAITIKFAPASLMGQFYTCRSQAALAIDYRNDYTDGPKFVTELTGEDAAEDAFDLANNPCRQDEREEVYGRRRSVSVGDIVVVDEEEYLCASFGWTLLETVV